MLSVAIPSWRLYPLSYSLLELANASLDVGQIDDALDFLNQHLQVAPTDADALRLRAALLARLPDRAADALADLDSLADPQPDDLRLLARLLETTDDLDRALATLGLVWERQYDLRDAEALLRLLLMARQPAEALCLLDQLPDEWTWRIWRGDAHASLGDSAEAIRHYQSALDAMPDTPLNAPLRDYLRDRMIRLTG